MAGRPPKSPKLKLLQGNLGKRPLKRPKKKPARKPKKISQWDMPVPQDLNKIGKTEWNRVVKFLLKNDKLYQADRSALKLMCQNLQMAQQAWEELAKLGSFVFRPTERYVQQLPHVSIFQKASNEYKSFAMQFGITPVARERMDFPDQEEDSLMESLID